MASYRHGVASFTGAAATTYGLTQSFSEDDSAEKAEARDANGHVAAYQTFNKTTAVS